MTIDPRDCRGASVCPHTHLLPLANQVNRWSQLVYFRREVQVIAGADLVEDAFA
jgi:hypothetical protein